MQRLDVVLERTQPEGMPAIPTDSSVIQTELPLESGKVTVRDHALWFKHIENAPELVEQLFALKAGERIKLVVDGMDFFL